MRIHHVTTLSIIALLGLGSQQTTIGQEVKVTQSTEKRSVVGAIATPSSEELNNQIKAVIVDQDGNQRVVELRGLGNGLWQGSMQDPDGHSSEAPADFLFREVDAENAVGSKSKSKVVATSTDSKPVVFGSVFYSDGKDKYQIGVSCEEIPEVLRAHLKLDPGMGLLVGRTFEGMPAHDQLKQHDIILKVNGRSAGSTKDLVEAAQQAGEKSETVVLRVLRSGDERDIVLNPAKQELAINPALKPMSEFSSSDFGRKYLVQTSDSNFVLNLVPGVGRSAMIVPAVGSQSTLENLETRIAELRVQIQELRNAVDELKK